MPKGYDSLFLHIKNLILKRFKKILKWVLLSLLFIIIAVTILVNTEWGQNFLARQVTNRLSRDLNTHISINRISLSLFNKLNLEGLYIEDQQKDTLLYAGRMQVRLTDWFFFKDRIELKYIGLENAIIHLNRSDSVWNYTFLEDYFSGESSGPGKKGPTLDLKKLYFKNVYLSKKDRWLGQDMLARFGELNLDAREVNFTSKNIHINSLVFTEPVFEIRNYSGLKPRTEKPAFENNHDEPGQADTSLQWNAAGWNVHVSLLRIDNGIFRNQKETDKPYFEYFDGRNIEFASIQGIFVNLDFKNDTITTKLNLKTRERSGFEVKSMVANVKFHPKAMEFDNLEIITNNSEIRHFFAMRYEDFSDMNDYLRKIRMEASFTETDIDSDDIAFFAPALKEWKKRITVTGRVRGTVDDLFAQNIQIDAGQGTTLNGNISLSGLPDINQTFIDFRANNFRTTYYDATTLFPSLKKIAAPRLSAIQYIHFTGSFTGFLRDFVTYGTIQTNLGTITSDLNMKLPEGKEPFYSGNIASENFNLGTFINNSKIGNIAFRSKVNGRGFKWETLAADFDGTISELVYNNYHYENIVAKGNLSNKLFNGYFSISDSNASASLDGLVDFTGKVPRFDFVAVVDTLNLKKINLLSDNYSFKGNLDLDFTGSNIDNFTGDARITHARLTMNGKAIPADSLIVNASYSDGIRRFTVNSNEFDGYIEGDYSLKDLPDAVQLFLNKYYPSYIRPPKKQITRESFRFDLQTRYVDQYIPLIDSSLNGFNNSHISGRLDFPNNQIALNAGVPSFSYKNYRFQNVLLQSNGNLEKLQLSASVDNTVVNDSLNVPQTKIYITAANDISQVQVETISYTTDIPSGSIKASVQTFADGVALVFDSSMFVMNGKQWTIEKNGELEFRSNAVSSGEVTLKESNQEIRLYTQPSDIGNWNDLNIDLKKVNIGDISPYFLKQNRLEGLISGHITVEDPNKTFNVAGDIQTEELRLDDDSVGSIQARVLYNNTTGELRASGRDINVNEKLSFDANLFLKDPDNKKQDVITITPDNYPVKIAERFIGTLFSDLRGYGTGQLKIIGKGNKRKYVGKIKLRDAGLRVKFTQCFYKIKDTELDFREDALDLGRLQLLDTVTGHTASITRGLLKHDSWRNMIFDIRAEVDDEPILLLNTGPRDNSSFYGMAKGTGSFTLTGPQQNMLIRINGVASYRDSSYITIPPYESRESGIADFLVERKYGRELTDSIFKGNVTNISYDVDLTANPLVNMKVILDELTGDEIRGRGNGILRISSGTNEDLSIRGRYNIIEGSYQFTFQSVFKKPFELKKEANNYIEWSGDPYDAKIRLEAVYRANNVSFAPLAGFSIDNRVTNFRGDVYVNALLTGDLFKPTFDFSLSFPENSIARTDQSLSFNLQQMQNNTNELNKQVSYLIVFNSFAPVENSLATGSIGSTLGEFATSTVSGIISNVINNELNQALSKILKNKVRLNFSGSLYNRNPFETSNGDGFNLGTNLNFSLTSSIIKNRVLLSLGAGLDAPVQETVEQQFEVLPDITVEILINESGTVRATFFHKQNIDYLTGTTSAGTAKTQRTGASIGRRSEGNTILEAIFGKRKKKNKKLQEKLQQAEMNKEEND